MPQGENRGAPLRGTGSHASHEAPAGLRPTGFDPARFQPETYEGKPRHMPKAERRELDAVVKAVRAHMDGLTDWRLETLMSGFMSVSPTNCSWQHYGLAELFVYEAASAIEARQGQDAEERLDAEHESAVAEGETPNPPQGDGQ